MHRSAAIRMKNFDEFHAIALRSVEAHSEMGANSLLIEFLGSFVVDVDNSIFLDKACQKKLRLIWESRCPSNHYVQSAKVKEPLACLC